MKIYTNSSKQAGFTLVELLVSIVVGAILVGSVNVIYTNQTYLSQQDRDTTLANAYAEGKVEALRSKGYSAINTGTTNITSELPSELSQPRSASLVITNHSTAVKQVQLTITYNQQGKSQTYTYTTLLGELGVGQY